MGEIIDIRLMNPVDLSSGWQPMEFL